MPEPSVNILIPTYNQSGYIAEAIDSALAQDYAGISIIVSDDCSTDDTFQVLRKYAEHPRVRVHRNEENLGRIGNYRRLLYECADAEWALNLDGDDILLDATMIRRYVDSIGEHDNIVFCTSRQWYGTIGKQLESDRADRIRKLTGEEYFFKYYANYNFNHQTSLYRTDIAKRIDFYSANIISSDAESFLRLALEGDVLVSKKKCAFWRAHESNKSTTADTREKYANAITLVDRVSKYVAERFSDQGDHLPNWRRRSLLEYVVPLSFRQLRTGNFRDLRWIWQQCVRFDSYLMLSAAPFDYAYRRLSRYIENWRLKVGV